MFAFATFYEMVSFFQGVYNAYQTDTVSRFSLVRPVFLAVKAQTFLSFASIITLSISCLIVTSVGMH